MAKRQVWYWFVSTSTKSAYKWRVSVWVGTQTR